MTKTTTKALQASIRRLRPEGIFSLTSDRLGEVEWHDGTQPVTQAQVDEVYAAELDKVQQASVPELRRQDYPSIGDQLDDLYKQGAFSPGMAARIRAVKDNYPKR